MRVALILLLSAGFVTACHSHDDHKHGSDKGHGHGESELEAVSVTLWTKKGELFVEYSPLIVGTESEFLAHVTVLSTFKPVLKGEATLTLLMGDGAGQTAKVAGPERPGIFIPVITPKRAGKCTLSLVVASPTLRERFNIGACRVFATKKAAKAAKSPDTSVGSTISFLKEQQWPIEFATIEAGKRELHAGVTVNGEIKAVPGNSVRLSAATAGRISFPTPVPRLGMAVKKGQLLATMQPIGTTVGNYSVLLANARTAQVELSAAKRQRDHLKPLVASNSVPKRRLNEAESRVSIAAARLRSARMQLGAYNAVASGRGSRLGSFRVVSPIDGTLVASKVSAGETVTSGALLFSVVDLRRVWVEGRVFEMDLAKVEQNHGAWFRVEGRERVFEIKEGNGKLVTLGHVVDRTTRTVPIVFEVDNPSQVLRLGQFAKLTVASGKRARVVAIPESAILTEGTQSVAYVQLEGETFQRRILRTGMRSRGWVEIRHAIKQGEHVVAKGAYDIKLSASSGNAPGHGHAH